MVNFIRKNWLFLLLALVAGLLVTLWGLGANKPKEAPLPSLPPIAQPKIQGDALSATVNIKFTLPNLPTEGKIYQTKSKAIAKEQAFKISNFFNISATPTTSDTSYYWNTDKLFLSVNTTTGEIVYGHYSQPEKQSLEFPPRAKLEDDARNIIKNLGLVSPGVTLVNSGNRFLKVNGNFVQTSQENGADLLEISLTPTVNDLPVVGDFGKSLVVAKFDRSGLLFSFNASSFFVEEKGNITYPFKSEGEIKKALITEGKVVIFGQDLEAETKKQLVSVDVNKIELVYFAAENSNALLPTFSFEGNANTSNSTTIPVLIYLPAIKSNYLQP